MAFTELYCDAAAGSNVNAGDNTANGVVTATNGAWSTVTNLFVATGGTPFSGVTVGDFCSLRLDGGTIAVYTARVTNVGSGGLTLTLSNSAFSGVAPSSGASGVTATTGGAWKGPNGAVKFPFAFISAAMTDVGGDIIRINFKGGTNYAITAAITHSLVGPVVFQGYTTTAGDGGKATIDGGTSGTSFNLLSVTGNGGRTFIDLIFSNNGASGTAQGVLLGATNGIDYISRCVVHDVRGSGYETATVGALIDTCEAYNCNQSNTATTGGFKISVATCVNCISHDNSGANNSGFVVNNFSAIGTFLSNCIADTNGKYGFLIPDNIGGILVNCDAYNNASDGVIGNSSAGFGYGFIFRNCNFVKNGGWGVNLGSGVNVGTLRNCGFGSGTQANTSGTVNNAGSVDLSGNVTYASGVTPWVDPANGDFRINLTAAKGTGFGSFTQTASSYAGTIGYPDIGAAQHQDSGGGTGPIGQVVKVASIGTY